MRARRARMLKYIIEHGSVAIGELAAVFPEVSEMTIRRDLEHLENMGEIIRTKGGAKSIAGLSMQMEAAYGSRELINSDLKKEISLKIQPLLEESGSIYFDAGSTTMQIASDIGEKKFFAMTNSPNIAMRLSLNENCEVSIVGGKLNRGNISLSGLGAAEFMKNINIGTAIVAASAFSPESGFTCGHYDEGELKKAVVQKAQRVIIVMDSTKAGKNLPFTFARPRDIDILVSDDKLEKGIKAYLKKEKIKVI